MARTSAGRSGIRQPSTTPFTVGSSESRAASLVVSTVEETPRSSRADRGGGDPPPVEGGPGAPNLVPPAPAPRRVRPRHHYHPRHARDSLRGAFTRRSPTSTSSESPASATSPGGMLRHSSSYGQVK